MNLVINTYITDEPLNEIHGKDSSWQKIREQNTSFRRRSKLDIFKYTLDSYKYLSFDKVFFWVECEDPTKHDAINEYILRIWPDAYISNRRCLTYNDYSVMVDIVPDDDWVFYSPNNDHVFWSNEIITNRLLDIMDYCCHYYLDHFTQNVGIFYSHLEEFRNLPYKDSWFGMRWNNDREPRALIDENLNFVSFISQYGENTSVQILSPNLFRTFFTSWRWPKSVEIRRLEDLRPYFHIANQLSVVPRFDICSHFDGQPSLDPAILPPLFIPDGYFEGAVDVAIDRPLYQVGKLNISSTFKLPPYIDSRCGADYIGKKLPLVLQRFIS